MIKWVYNKIQDFIYLFLNSVCIIDLSKKNSIQCLKFFKIIFIDKYNRDFFLPS